MFASPGESRYCGGVFHFALMHMARSPGLPPSPERLLAEAQSRANAGDMAGAEKLLRQVPRTSSAAVDAARLLGIFKFSQGNFVEAAQLFLRVLKSPSVISADHVNHGLALAKLGQSGKAEAAYRQALQLEPQSSEAWFNLGNLFRAEDAQAEAIAAYEEAIACAPQDYRAHFNLGLAHAKRDTPLAAIACFERTLELSSGHIDAHNELGLAQAALGDQEAAEQRYRRVLSTDPDHIPALTNLGNALAARRRFDDAHRCFLRLVAIPDCPAASLVAFAQMLLRVRRTDEGEKMLRRALVLEPDHGDALAALAMVLQWQCRWDELEAIRPRLVKMSLQASRNGQRSPIAPHTALSQYLSPAEERLIAESWSREQRAAMTSLSNQQGFTYPPRKRDKIRLGYFSNDFNSQATAHLIAGLFEQHDRDRFEVFAYSFGADDGSTWRQRIEAASDQFVDVTHEGYAATAARMNRDEVDILLDFKGFTAEARPQVYALRPAPIQVNYLGFPGTIGADYMDYIIADEIVIPDDERIHYAEQVVYLPESYQANDNRQEIGDWPATRADAGLPETGIVFSCFNETYKIDRTIFDIWMRLLGRVPGSVLWLRDHNARLRASLRAAAEAAGVEGARIVFAEMLPKEQHLARCRLADLFVDSYALTAHTTATDSLWAGVPMVTCPRNTFATRVGKSLLDNLGLPELVVDSLEDYETLAVRLVTTPDELAQLHKRLSENLKTAPLFNTTRLTRHLEQAFERMWVRYRLGKKPESFRVPSLPV